MKKVFFSAVLIAAASLSSNAQLKVNNQGRVGMCTLNPNNLANVTIQQTSNNYGTGGLSLRSTDLRHSIHMGQYPANAHMGTTTDVIAFYQWYTSYNHVWFSGYTIASDRSLKTNVKTMENNVENLMKFRPTSYFLKDDLRSKEPKLTYGFIAQEVHEDFPGLTDTCNGVMGVSYHQVIPMLVGGTQEQQKSIETLENEIEDLKSQIAELKVNIPLKEETTENAAVLYQNKPNPFKERTTISYELPTTFGSASMMIFDMNGVLLKTIQLEKNSNGQVTIEGRQFKPGMYLYSLVVDDVEVDTKKMILSK